MREKLQQNKENKEKKKAARDSFERNDVKRSLKVKMLVKLGLGMWKKRKWKGFMAYGLGCRLLALMNDCNLSKVGCALEKLKGM